MKIRAIALNDVRRFTAPVRIDGIGDGLNVLCEPNEHGKSTLFDALQALFFIRHGGKSKEVQALRPHAGGAPEVTVEVETGDGRFVLFKRWLSKPVAWVHRGDRLVAQADAAEDWITRLLGDGEGGPSGLLWVRQGIMGLDEGTKAEQDRAKGTRQDLLSSVAGEVDDMTGGKRMDAALRRCRDDLSDLATSKGKPKANGRWQVAIERLETLRTEEADLESKVADLATALSDRRRLNRELAGLTDAEATAGRRARLDEAMATHAAAKRHAEAVADATRALQTAELTVTTRQFRLDGATDALRERDNAQAECKAAIETAERLRRERDMAQAADDACRKAAAQAETAERAARKAHHDAMRAQAARDGVARRAELVDRLTRADKAQVAARNAAAAARRGPDAATLRKLERLANDLATARHMRDATAPQLRLAYEPGRDGEVSMEGAALPGGMPVPVTDGATLTLGEIGTLTIRGLPKGDKDVIAAETALQTALDQVGAVDMDSARRAADDRARAEAALAEHRAALDSLAPDGVEALRAVIADLPQDADGTVPDLPTAEADLEAAEQSGIEARSARQVASERLSNLQGRLASAEATQASAEGRLTRAEDALGRLGEIDMAALKGDLAQAAEALRTAREAHARQVAAAPDLAAAQAGLDRARSVEDSARAAIADLRPAIAGLDERIRAIAGDAVEERLAETAQRREAAEHALAAIDREVAILQRLAEMLEAARSEARDRYFAPVAAELRPLLRLLWPDAELTWADDTVLPRTLIRDGQEEAIDILSGGTREQVALLVRLAFARMLARAGRHAPVILDDALVFTDDDRIERMFDALHRQAGDIQIIVLSCRQRAFRNLGGKVLRLNPA